MTTCRPNLGLGKHRSGSRFAIQHANTILAWRSLKACDGTGLLSIGSHSNIQFSTQGTSCEDGENQSKSSREKERGCCAVGHGRRVGRCGSNSRWRSLDARRRRNGRGLKESRKSDAGSQDHSKACGAKIFGKDEKDCPQESDRPKEAAKKVVVKTTMHRPRSRN